VLAYDSVNSRFLMSWADTKKIAVSAQLLNADGTRFGQTITVMNNLFLHWSDDGPVSAAYDPDTQRFLIVTRDAQSLSRQALSADGTLFGQTVVLSNTVDEGDRSVVLYDGANKRYLVSWSDYSRLQGQFLNPDGTLQGASFTLSDALRGLWHHALAYDPADRHYFEVYDSMSYDPDQVYGQMVNADGTPLGSASGSQFLVSSSAFPGSRNPSLAFNSTDRKFLAVWEYDGPDARYPDIHGRMINADGSLEGDIFVAVAGGQ
jgi:hypothetical protein